MSNYQNVAIIVLAAGKGARMKSDLAKVLHPVAGKSMVLHVLECANRVCSDHIHVVVGHQAERVRQVVREHYDVRFSMQKQLLGTGDAVKAAIPGINAEVKNVLVLCGDVPLIQEETLKLLIDAHVESGAVATVLAVDVANPKGYGRLLLDDTGNLVAIREEADASDEEKKICKVNSGIFCFEKQFLFSAIDRLKPENNQSEYYLTDIIAIAKNEDRLMSVVTLDDPDQVIGVNTIAELEKAERLIR